MITLSPPATAAAAADSNKSKQFTSQIGERIRDVSFSSYLDGAEETFILKLTESEEAETNFKSSKIVKCHQDNEIDVFNAEKYFNEQGDDDEIQNKNQEHELYEMNTSISSKSSLNSRSSLLLQNIPQKTNSYKSYKKSFFSKFGCNCYDKNSVNVIDDNHHPLEMINSSSNCTRGRTRPGKTGDFPNMSDHQNQIKSSAQKEDFMFPMFKSNREDKDTEDCPRKSLEVFGTDAQRSRNVSGLSMEKRLNMLTWDGIDIEIPSKSTRLMYNDDSDSDASSNLFEIESFSTNPSQYFTTQTSDAMSRTTTGYAPSEASIDWSVVTASAADFGVMSDSEELRTNSSRIRTRDCRLDGKNSVVGGKSKRHSSILSGCYSHKAVMVVADSYRTVEQVSAPRH